MIAAVVKGLLNKLNEIQIKHEWQYLFTLQCMEQVIYDILIHNLTCALVTHALIILLLLAVALLLNQSYCSWSSYNLQICVFLQEYVNRVN